MSQNQESVPSSKPEVPKARKRRRRRLGVSFTVVVVMLCAAVVEIPHALSASLHRNESYAIATLKNISSGQSQAQASGVIDANGNGQGEYGFLAELAGGVPLRGKPDSRMKPAVLSELFGKVVNGRVEKGGYYFQMFLPGEDGIWVPEAWNGGTPPGGVDVGMTEVGWLCYAWPVEVGVTGNRAFLIEQNGNLVATNQAAEVYSGQVSPPPGLAGFLSGGGWNVAANKADVRGNTWVVV